MDHMPKRGQVNATSMLRSYWGSTVKAPAINDYTPAYWMTHERGRYDMQSKVASSLQKDI